MASAVRFEWPIAVRAGAVRDLRGHERTRATTRDAASLLVAPQPSHQMIRVAASTGGVGRSGPSQTLCRISCSENAACRTLRKIVSSVPTLVHRAAAEAGIDQHRPVQSLYRRAASSAARCLLQKREAEDSPRLTNSLAGTHERLAVRARATTVLRFMRRVTPTRAGVQTSESYTRAGKLNATESCSPVNAHTRMNALVSASWYWITETRPTRFDLR